jgi:lipopolysaccharide transport system ATP-binding protein
MSAIQFDAVSKRFTLHHERPRSMQELLLHALQGRRQSSKEEYWALRDVSFAIEQGETVGIIGPNGAGKSTVLKLISRIIEPTSGEIEVEGRVGGLLELGAGFHPDLTGRENIYLNGSILGMSQKEIDRQIDDIIGFAEIERFIDVPVRHYSSGMLVRLGFSVAIHTRPDILLIDEVLAVGDAAFREKCADKIAEFRRGKCTILLVSHDLASIQELCSQAVWLEDGQIQLMGEAQRVISSYAACVEEELEAKLDLDNRGTRQTVSQRGRLQIREVKMVDVEDRPRWTFHSGEPLHLHVAYEATHRVENPVFSILIHRSDGLYVSSTNTYNIDPFDVGPIEGRGELVIHIDRLDLYAGDYFLSVGAYFEPDPPYWSEPAHFLDKQYKFRIVSEGRHGVYVLPAEWTHNTKQGGRF